MGCLARPAANEGGRAMLKQRAFLIEILTAAGLIVAPFVLGFVSHHEAMLSDIGTGAAIVADVL